MSQKIKTRNYIIFWVSFLLFLIIAPLGLIYFQGYKRTFRTDKDAYVYENSPDANYGTRDYLRVGTSNGGDLEIYLHFIISSNSDNWREAWIYVDFYTGSTYVDIGISLTSNTWDEMNITWNNRPEPTVYEGHLFYDGSSNGFRINSYQIINDEVSVCLYPIWVDGGGFIEGHSKEGASNSDQIAYIEITYMGYDLTDLGTVLKTSIIILGVLGLAVLAFYVAVRLNFIRMKSKQKLLINQNL